MIKDFPHKYYFFGSKDSSDIDVLLSVDNISKNKEENIQYIKQLNKEFNLNWNSNLIIIKNGIVTDTIPSKGTIDGINNSLYYTYNLHKQNFDNPIKTPVKRNKLLNLYKCIRACLTNCTRVDNEHRNKIMPLKGIHEFKNKIESLTWLNYTKIDNFNQRYQTDVDTWKIIAFHLGQTISLFNDNIEIYTKKYLIKYHPELYNFIYRKQITIDDKHILQYKKQELLNIINNLTFENIKQPNNFYNILFCNDEIIDMYQEIAL